jgi:hypothetical protein
LKSRSGSYKKILIEESLLKSHGDYLRTNLEAIKSLELNPQDFTAIYILLFLRIKHQKNWLQKKELKQFHKKDHNVSSTLLLKIIPNSFQLNVWEIEKLKGITTLNLFEHFTLKAIPQSIHRSMINWINGLWSIQLLEHIPTSRELLRLQVKNNRCITVITDPQRIDCLVLNKRDPLSFVLHDLMHADQFFSQIDSQIGQLGFYKLIDSLYELPELMFHLKSNAEFKTEFEYVASDMNAYVIHLFKCLKSSVLRLENGPSFWENILNWWEMNEEEKFSSRLLNTPDFSVKHEALLKTFFEKNQEIF